MGALLLVISAILKLMILSIECFLQTAVISFVAGILMRFKGSTSFAINEPSHEIHNMMKFDLRYYEENSDAPYRLLHRCIVGSQQTAKVRAFFVFRIQGSQWPESLFLSVLNPELRELA